MSMAIKRPSFNKFEHFKQSGFFLETFPERKFSSLSIFSTRLQNCNFLIFSSVQIIKVDGHERLVVCLLFGPPISKNWKNIVT